MKSTKSGDYEASAEEGGEELELFREPSPEEDGEEGGPADAPLPPGEVPRPRARPLRVVAVSGAKGGVGKSLIAANLGLYFATIGRRVVVVDADRTGANIHTFLGVERSGGVVPYVASTFEPASGWPTVGAAPPDDLEVAAGRAPWFVAGMVETPVAGLKLLHAGMDEPLSGVAHRPDRRKLMADLRALDAEYVVVDLGAGTERWLLDFWLEADLSIFVALPEPTAIENTYRFIRRAFGRYLRQVAPDAETRKRLVRKLRQAERAPSPLDLARTLDADADPMAALVRSAVESFPFRMVLNQTRLRADLELGDRMRSAARRRLGVHVDYVGYIDYDDTAWSCVRMRRPLLVESPGTKASKSIEKVARRLLSLEAGKAPSKPLRTVPPETHHDLLEVDRGATDEEIRRAYKRAKDVYAADALCCYGLFDVHGLEALRTRLDEAYDVLLDPARRRPYELSVFPPDPDRSGDRPPAVVQGEPKPPPPVITPETEFTGGIIRAVRESQGVDVREISQHTKIGATYLRAIEDDDFSSLPAAVYVRGFVKELAKYLKLDPEHVSRTYVRRYARYLDERDRA